MLGFSFYVLLTAMLLSSNILGVFRNYKSLPSINIYREGDWEITLQIDNFCAYSFNQNVLLVDTNI